MNILVLANSQSIHTLNFVKVISKVFNNTKITIFDLSNEQYLNIEANNFYKNNDIHVCGNNLRSHVLNENLVSNIPKLNTYFYVKKLSRKFNDLGEFDICFVHFIDRLKVELINRNSFIREIVPVFWGSDLLRSDFKNKSFKMFFEKSSHIVFNTEHMKLEFLNRYSKEFNHKLKVIKFPINSFEIIDSIFMEENRESLKKNLDIPLNKKIIVCGHAASKAEQHLLIINALKNLDLKAKKEIFLIFPLTYGDKNLKEYQLQVERALQEDLDLEFRILDKYLTNENMIKYMTVADVFINFIKTDAFSATMQENIYTESLMISGDWLKYYELKNNDIYYLEVKKISELTSILNNLDLYLDTYKLKENTNKIKMISSLDYIIQQWGRLLN